MALPVTITGISTAVAPVGPFANNVEVNQWDHTSVTAFGANASSNVKLGLPFTTVSANSITDVGFWIYKVSATDDVLVSLYAADASYFPTGSALATATVPNATINPTARQFVLVKFSSPVVVSSGAKYVAVLERTGAINGSQYFTIGYNGFGAAYPPLVAYDGTSWANSATTGKANIVVGTAVNSAFYFFGRNGTTATTLSAYKATDPATSWASIATKTGFTTAILTLNGYQVGSVVHIVVCDGTAATSVATKYVSFDTSTDTFLATTETVAAAASNAGQSGTVPVGCSVVVRGNGEAVAFYNGVQTKTSGTFRARVYYRRRTAVNTWSTETQVDNNTGIENLFPTAVLGAADRVHFVWSVLPSTYYRTLSAANALSAAASSASLSTPGDAVSYDRSGTTKVVVTGNTGGQYTMRFDSADSPTPTFVNHAIAAASAPHRIGVDTETDDVTIVYRSTADSDLYAIKSTDDGATFGSPVSFFVGTIANVDTAVSRSSSGSMYQRGNQIVVGYIVNDNGTLKYNESLVRTVDTGVRYWRGGTATWDATAGSKWADTVGGAAGASVPSNTHDVFFDATSGAVTVTTGSGINAVKSINFTGFTGTFTGSTAWACAGSLTLSSSMTFTVTGTLVLSGTVTKTITSNGKTFGGTVALTGGGTVLADNFICNGTIDVASSATLNASNNNVNVDCVDCNFNTGATVSLGNGIWTVNGDWTMAAGATVNCDLSTIKLVADGFYTLFAGGSKTYYNLENRTVTDSRVEITGSNTFNIFDIATINNQHEVLFTAGTTTTVNELKRTTGTGHILGSMTAAAHTLVDANGGENVLLNTTVSYSNASGATFKYGTDGGNNTGWESAVVLPAEGTGTLAAQSATTVAPGKSSSVGTGALTAVPTQRTNLIQYSEELDRSSVWTAANLYVTIANDALAPNGTQTAERFTDHETATNHYVHQTFTVAPDTYTLSVHVKPSGLTWLKLYHGADQNRWVNFNLSGAGSLGTSFGSITGGIVALPNGWYRCWVTDSTDTQIANDLAFMVMSGDYGMTGYAGSYQYLWLWGAQFERGTIATSYIPTTATAVSVADTLVGTGTAQWIAIGALVAGATRTNWALQSGDLDTAYWLANSVTVTANATTAPDTTVTAERINDIAISSQHYIYQANIPAHVGEVYTVSIHAKAGTLQWLGVMSNASGLCWANFDVTNGVLGQKSVAGITQRIEALPNGWYRCSATLPACTVEGPSYIYFYVAQADVAFGSATYAGGTGNLYLWGAQIELAGAPTAYIQTTTAPVTVGTPPLLTGAGTVITPPAIGTGTLASQSATTNIFGKSESVGTGALAAIGTVLATNLLTWSQDFDNAVWSKAAVAVSANAITAPDGTLTADTATSDASNTAHTVFLGIGLVVTTGTYTESIYAKAGTGRWLQLSDSVYCNFDLVNGVTGQGNSAGTIVPVGDGWYRCSITRSGTPTVRPRYCILTADTAAVNPAHTSVLSIHLWGAQGEAGAVAAIYVPTQATAASLYDVLTGTGIAPSVATGALVAGARTNFTAYSQEFERWGSSGVSVIADAIVAPDSTTTADQVQDFGSTNYHSLNLTIPGSVGGILKLATVTCSVFAKAGTLTWLQVYNNSLPSVSANFDLANGVVGLTTDPGLISAVITPAGNGWYRCSVTFVQTGASPQPWFRLMDANTAGLVMWPGTGTGTLYLWGAQVEQGSTPTAYLPSTATIATTGSTRTNRFLQSQGAQDSFWAKVDITVTTNTQVAPDGTNTADRISETTSGVEHYFQPTYTIDNSVGGPQTLSIYAKWVSGPAVGLQLSTSDGTNLVYANFNLQSGTLGAIKSANATSLIESLGSGWYRCSVSGPSVGTTTQTYIRMLDAGESSSYAGTGSVVYVWGAQHEVGIKPSGYMPTTATAITAPAQNFYGTGNVISAPVTGTGTLTSDIADLDVFATVSSTGVAALIAADRTLAGTGISQVIATGALVVGGGGTSITNLALQSETLDVSPWALSGSTVTANVATAPNATTTAELITDTASSGLHLISLPFGLLNDQTLTHSIYAKAGTLSWLQIFLQPSGRWANFNLASGVVGNVSSGTTAQITPVGDGWYRCSINGATGNDNLYLLLATSNVSGVSSYAGTGSGNLYLWGAQVETGTAPTAYIPTTTVPVTVPGQALTGIGISESRQTSAVLASQNNLLLGSGLSSSIGVVAGLQAESSAIVGTMVLAPVTGTAALAATSAATVGPGISQSRSTLAVLASATSIATALGISSSKQTSSVLVANVSVVAGAGAATWIGTGALASPVAVVAGAGLTHWSATGALAAQASALSGAGLSRWSATGAVQSASASAVGSGISSSAITATSLPASVAFVFGAEGVTVVSGVGTPVAQNATAVSVGISSSRSTAAALTDASATVSSIAVARSEGTGALVVSGVSAISGAGVVASVGSGPVQAGVSAIVALGTSRWLVAGALVPSAAVVAGSGVSVYVATGSLFASVAAVSSAGMSGSAATASLLASVSGVYGYEGTATVQGTGTLLAQSRVLSGAATASTAGTGVLASSVASLSSAALSGSAGIGSPTASVSVIAGAGKNGQIGAATLDSQAAALMSVGTSQLLGAGSLLPSSSALLGVGTSQLLGVGTLIADAVSLSGEGATASVGDGALASTVARVIGSASNLTLGSGDIVESPLRLSASGLSSSKGTAALLDERATLSGAGVMSAVGVGAIVSRRALMLGFGGQVSVGTGNLVSGNTTLSGIELAPAVGAGALVSPVTSVSGVGKAGAVDYEYPPPAQLPGGVSGTTTWTGQTATWYETGYGKTSTYYDWKKAA